LAEARLRPVETRQAAERAGESGRFPAAILGDGEPAVNAVKDKKDGPPPAVFSAPPERDLERKLKKHPGDPNAKADVGSDLSMDASDPSSAAQPGSSDEPAPSSGFPADGRK
jgi:hypothetical protein